MDLLAVQGTLKSLLQHHSSKASVLQHSDTLTKVLFNCLPLIIPTFDVFVGLFLLSVTSVDYFSWSPVSLFCYVN